MSNRKLLPAMFLLVVCLVSGCGSRKMSESGGVAPAARTVAVTKVVSKPLDITLHLPAELKPYEMVATYAKIPGFVDWIGVDRGSHVKSGQVLIRLSAPELLSQRAEAESKVQSAESQLASAQAKLAADQSTFERLQSAAQTPGVVAGNDLTIANKAAQADQAQVRALQANADAAKQAFRAVLETEQYLQIHAPFDGVVIERDVHPGALVGPNQQTPMLRIQTLSPLRLVVPVPEAYSAGVKEHSRINFSVPSFPAEVFTATVTRISHAVDEKTRTMAVELDVPNPSGRLSAGTFAEVQWPVQRPKVSLLVPTSAIASNLERTFVVRVREGTTEWVDVKSGATSGNLTEVFGNLRPDELVVVRGTDELQPGTAVETQPAKGN